MGHALRERQQHHVLLMAASPPTCNHMSESEKSWVNRARSNGTSGISRYATFELPQPNCNGTKNTWQLSYQRVGSGLSLLGNAASDQATICLQVEDDVVTLKCQNIAIPCSTRVQGTLLLEQHTEANKYFQIC